MPELLEWNTFYYIVGAAAGALIGLQFVVITLLAERPHPQMAEAGAAFATPSVVHFAVALLLSAIISIPWRAISGLSLIWGLLGTVGVVYSIMVAQRMRKQSAYRPVFEDWLFHLVLPILAYAMLAASMFVAWSHARTALFIVGSATLIFLFVGIHNAWDAVTYQIFVHLPSTPKSKRR